MGNSFGIIIDRPILDLLGIEPGAELELTPQDGGSLSSAGGQGIMGYPRASGDEQGEEDSSGAALKELAE